MKTKFDSCINSNLPTSSPFLRRWNSNRRQTIIESTTSMRGKMLETSSVCTRPRSRVQVEKKCTLDSAHWRRRKGSDHRYVRHGRIASTTHTSTPQRVPHQLSLKRSNLPNPMANTPRANTHTRTSDTHDARKRPGVGLDRRESWRSEHRECLLFQYPKRACVHASSSQGQFAWW